MFTNDWPKAETLHRTELYEQNYLDFWTRSSMKGCFRRISSEANEKNGFKSQSFGDIFGVSQWKEVSVTSVCMVGVSEERDWQLLYWDPLEAELQWSQSFLCSKCGGSDAH